MDTKNKKLRLNKETIRNLSDDSLGKVGGGDGSGGGDSGSCVCTNIYPSGLICVPICLQSVIVCQQ